MMAKAEEDRLKQEVMRLEIRRTEMEMLKEAVRAGIQPHLIPHLFGGGSGSIQGGVFTPVSPTNQGPKQAPPASSRAPFAAPQAIPPFIKATQSPRYLPKLDTSNLPPTPQAHTAAPQTSHEQRPSISHHAAEQLQSAPAAGNNEPADTSSLFFHHWQPPPQTLGGLQHNQQQQQQASTIVDQSSTNRSLNTGDGPPTSPSPRKRKMQQYHILNPLASPSAGSPRRSPSRGHVRHRSEASGLTHRFADQYAPAVQLNNGYSAKLSSDRESPKVQQPQYQAPPPTSQEIDAARKRKRSAQQDGEQPLPAATASAVGSTEASWAPQSIAEESEKDADHRG